MHMRSSCAKTAHEDPTSRRFILCLIKSFVFLGSFGRILSTLLAQAISDTTRSLPNFNQNLWDTMTSSNNVVRSSHLLSTSQNSASALSRTLSSSMLQEHNKNVMDPHHGSSTSSIVVIEGVEHPNS